jgi:hypothetical protein
LREGYSLSISAIGRIGICSSIVLGVLSSVVGGIGWAVDTRRCRAIVGSPARSSAVTTIAAATVRAAIGVMRTSVRAAVRMITITSIAVTSIARGAALEFFILLLDVGNQILAELLGLFDHVGIRSPNSMLANCVEIPIEIPLRDMEEHVLVAFPIRGCFQVARSSALDLHTTSSLLLNVLDVSTTMSNNLSA